MRKIQWIKRVKNILKEDSGIGVVEIILILVGIFTPYYGVGIRCITQKYGDK